MSSGDADVEEPEAPRRVPNRRGEGLELGPRRLGLHQLPAADPEPGKDREREDDDPHAAQPGVNCRHIAIEWLIAGMSVSMLDPVVVIPDIASK